MTNAFFSAVTVEHIFCVLSDPQRFCFVEVNTSTLKSSLSNTCDGLAGRRELRMDDLHSRNWILIARHANPYLYDTIQLVASDRGIRASDISQITAPEEAPELILGHEGLAFLPRTAAWRIAREGITIRPLAENRLRLITHLAVRADSKSRFVNEFVKATARKLSRVGQPVQRQLPLTG